MDDTPPAWWKPVISRKHFHRQRQHHIHWLITHGYLENSPIYLIDGRTLENLELTALGQYTCETGRL